MLKHKLLTKVTICNHNGERWQIALVKTNTDYVIANHYHGAHDSWGSGEYFPLTTPIESVYVLFAERLCAERTSIFTKEITA
jgi:hypothetical protein